MSLQEELEKFYSQFLNEHIASDALKFDLRDSSARLGKSEIYKRMQEFWANMPSIIDVYAEDLNTTVGKKIVTKALKAGDNLNVIFTPPKPAGILINEFEFSVGNARITISNNIELPSKPSVSQVEALDIIIERELALEAAGKLPKRSSIFTFNHKSKRDDVAAALDAATPALEAKGWKVRKGLKNG